MIERLFFVGMFWTVLVCPALYWIGISPETIHRCGGSLLIGAALMGLCVEHNLPYPIPGHQEAADPVHLSQKDITAIACIQETLRTTDREVYPCGTIWYELPLTQEELDAFQAVTLPSPGEGA